MGRATTAAAAAVADAALVIYRDGQSLYVDANTVVEADLSEMAVPSKAEIKALFDKVQVSTDQDASVKVMPIGKALRRQVFRLYEMGVARADLSSKDEFWDLLGLVCGLGVKGQELAAKLDTQPEIISRYRARKAAPTTKVMRRVVLDAALALVA